MARTILTTPGEDVDVGGTVTVVGTRSPGEVITITRGNISLDASFNAGGDTIVLPGNSGTYTVRLSGSQAIIASNGVTVSIPLGTAGTAIQFSDETLTLRINTSAGTAMLGDQTITTTAAPVTGDGSASSTLTLDNDTVIGAASTVIQGVDTVILGSGRGETGESGHTYEITLENHNAPPDSQVLTIDGSALAADTDDAGPLSHEHLFISASAVTSYSLTILGGAAPDVLIGGAQADQISGGGSSDWINSREGADILTGGGGADLFIYRDARDSSGSFGRDRITDFVSGEDWLAAMSFELFIFSGNASNAAGATALLTADDGWLDAVFQQDERLLWVDMNDDGALSASDVSIHLPTVSSLPDTDTLVFSPYGTIVFAETYGDDTIDDTAAVIDTSLLSFALGDDPNLTDPNVPSAELRGFIAHAEEEDWFEIYLEAGQTITLDVDGAYDPSDPSELDSVIGIFDADLNLVAINDDSSSLDSGSTSTADSYLVYEVEVTGTYYVAIGSLDVTVDVPQDYHVLLSVSGG